MTHPKFVQIAVSPSYLFGLSETGEVYQLVDETAGEQVTASGLVVVNEKKQTWTPVDEVVRRA